MPALNNLLHWFLKLIFLIVIICLFVPLSPKMPAMGLDASWALGLNQAVAQGLAFGKDILFTLGPYSSIYTETYHPATDLMMIVGSLYLALAYWLCCVYLVQGGRWYWILSFSLFIFGMVYSRDALFFSYPLLAALTSFIFARSDKTMINLAIIFSPFGLLPLIKGTLLPLCTVVAALCSLFFIAEKKKKFALICWVSPLISMVLFWIGAGQSLQNLPGFLVNTFLMVCGFTEAMGTDSNTNEMVLYLVTCVCMLIVIFLHKQTAISRIFLLGVYTVFLLVSFKAGFTRYDGHVLIAGTSILMAALLLPFIIKSKAVFPVVLLALITWGFVDNLYTKALVRNNFIPLYKSKWYGLENRINNEDSLKQDFKLFMSFFKKQSQFPVLPGTTDIYSYSQTALIASGNTWAPRPVFQSYSAFTPRLIGENKKFLLSKHSPDNIIFRVEPIDEKFPSLEDGATWSLLLTQYQPTQVIKDFLFLEKKLNPEKFTEATKTENHYFKEVVNLPNIKTPVFAEIEINPTVFGQLATLFFKPSQLFIRVKLLDGTTRQYRMVASMAKSGFLFSPLVENTSEFAMLYNKQDQLNGKVIKSFSIEPSEGKTWHWKTDYVVHYTYKI